MIALLLTGCVIGNVVLAIALWDLNRRCAKAFKFVDADIACLARAFGERQKTEEARFGIALREQEELLAMLWYTAFGMEAAEVDRHVPSGRLTEVNGLRPRLKVHDPLFVTEPLRFTSR